MIRRLAAEALGTGLLIVAVIGSGIMATNLTDDVALQLLCNAVATGGALVALILIFAPVSGASFNPAEVVATVGLLLEIWGTIRANRSNLVPFTVAAWITGAYFFTSSTSLANPAVSIARSLSNSFAGIDPNSVPAFIAMQIIGAFVGYSIIRWLFEQGAKS